MSVKAVIFDLYGTLVNIRTDENDPAVYRELSKFLSYNHVMIEPDHLQRIYTDRIRAFLEKSREQYPDVDVLKVFTEIIHQFGAGRMEMRLPHYTARLFRSLSRKVFEPFPGVYGMLERLRDRCPLAVLSDAQRAYTDREIEMLKLGWFFDQILLSSDYGFRKPEPRYFGMALDALGVRPSDAIYVGDNAFRDMFGAKKAGMRMVLVRSQEREFEGVTPDAYIENIAELESVLPELGMEL